MYLVLDTETTGLSPRDRIVSICWAIYDTDGDEISTAHHIVYPNGFTIPADATAVHGITTQYARQHGIPIGDALTSLRDDIATQMPRLYVGHNVSYDRPIILNEYARLAAEENLSPSRRSAL